MKKESTYQVRKEFLLAKIRAGRTQMKDQYTSPRQTTASTYASPFGVNIPKLISLASRHPMLVTTLAATTVALLARKKPRKSSAQIRRPYDIYETNSLPGRFTLAMKALPYLIPLVSRVLQALKRTNQSVEV